MLAKFLNALNDMRPRQLLLAAGGIALLMFALVYFALSSLTREVMPMQESTVKQTVQRSVVVAKEDIAPHEIINESMVEVKDMPEELIPDGALMSVMDLAGKPAVSRIYAGDVLTTQKIFLDKSRAGFTGMIPADCRAVSVAVSSVTGVAGFARPGDYVDVILVEKDKRGATSKLLLQNILLLGINQEVEGNKETKTDGKGVKVTPPSVATLALQADDMLELLSAAAIGEIYLVLRPFQPQDVYVLHRQHTMQAAYGNQPTAAAMPAMPAVQPSVPAPAAAASAAPRSGRFRIIEGDKIK